jgi:hypothetical protein
MVAREHLINALRSKNFHFKRQADRVELYKQAGTTVRVEVRRRDFIDRAAAVHVLKTAGFSPDEIRQFLADCDNTHH